MNTTLQNNENRRTPSLIKLFLSFLKLGAAAFGGPAMVVYIRRMVVEQNKWLDDNTFRNGVAFCQMVPGATAIQTTAYVGLMLRGISGAAVCFIGFGLPAFSIMMILSFVYQQFHGQPVTTSIFNGLQTIVIAIIANAAISFGRTSVKNWKSIVIAFTAAILFGFGINPFLVILLSAVLGLLLFWKQQSSSVKSTPKPISTLKPVLIILSTIIVLAIILFFINRNLFDMATLMFRIDLFAFGGGFASVPLMFNEVVNVNSWMDGKTLMDGIALGQISPGPIVITATFIGYIMSGPLGGLISTVYVFSPSFLIVTGIYPYFDNFRNSPYFTKIINGILSSFVGLLVSTTILFAIKVHWDILHIIIAAASFTALWFKIEIYWIVLAGILISIFLL
jgi:chromate transporter